MVTRGLALLCAMLALLPGASRGQSAQPRTPPKATPGVSVTLTPPPPPAPIDPTLSNYLSVVGARILPQTSAGNLVPVEFDLKPSSDKAISAWGVSLTAHYSDGATLATPVSEDSLEGAYRASLPGTWTVRLLPRGGPLVNGEVRPEWALVRGNSAGGSLLSVDGQVTAIVFLDRTARGDSSVIRQIAAARKAESDERAAFLGNLQAAIKDAGVREAAAQRSADVGERLRAAFLAQPQPSDDQGKSAHRRAELNRFVNALASSQAIFDFLLGDQQAMQALYAEHSVLKEEK